MTELFRNELTRRTFLAGAGQTIVAASVAATAVIPAMAQAPTPPDPDVRPIPLPPTEAITEQQPGPEKLPLPPDRRIGFAVVGLGNLAINQIIPAFSECKNARLTAVVSGDAAKANEIARQHGVPARSVYNYQNYDSIKDNPDVQVIYIVLPNALHEEYVVRGAAAGKHILCEKPMATTPDECERMIAACSKAGKKLMIAYRIQYEPNNRAIRKMVQDAQFGPVKFIEAVNGQNQGDPRQWRQKKALAGGGSLPDVGLYCLNTTRFLLGEEPGEVLASTYSTPGDPRFTEVEETVLWQMKFPSGIQSNNLSTYGAHESRRYRVHAAQGWFGMDPAFGYDGLRMERSHAEGMMEIRETPSLSPKNQFAAEMDHMAECVMQDKTPYTPGEEGLQDHRIMAAIYESARTGRPVKLARILTKDTFRGTQPSQS
jgi:predicted dehydrogenase